MGGGGTVPIIELCLGLALSGSIRKEIADAGEGRASFGRPSNFAFENMIERNFAIQGLIKIVAVHADDTLASSEGRQPLIGEAAIADEEATGSSCLLFDLAVKSVQLGDAYGLALPLSLYEIRLLAELEASVDLFAPQAKRLMGCDAGPLCP